MRSEEGVSVWHMIIATYTTVLYCTVWYCTRVLCNTVYVIYEYSYSTSVYLVHSKHSKHCARVHCCRQSALPYSTVPDTRPPRHHDTVPGLKTRRRAAPAPLIFRALSVVLFRAVVVERARCGRTERFCAVVPSGSGAGGGGRERGERGLSEE